METIFENKKCLDESILEDQPALPLHCDKAKVRYPEVDGSRIFCEIEETGPPLLLLNGGNGGHQSYHPYLSPLMRSPR